MHITNILNNMEKEGFDGYLLANFSNINYLSGYNPTSFAFMVIKDDPIVYTSKMDLEIANKDSSIEIRAFDSFSVLVNDLKDCSIKSLAIEPSLEFSVYEKFRDDFEIASTDFINKERAIKSKEEISKIEKATEIAQDAFKRLNITENQDSENIIAFNLERFMLEGGATNPSFETIVSRGATSSLPHSTPSSNSSGSPILIDWGAKYGGYCSDNTRTVVYTEKEHEIFDIVLDAHDKTISNMKAGMKCCEVDKIARDIITDYGYGDSFIHSTGHSLGLDIHENPSFSTKDETVLEKGMVMTVEPGIYLEGEFGVRLEDTVAIGSNVRVLGKLPIRIE